MCVMRSEVIIASQIDLSDALITQQVTDAQLLSVLSKNAKLLSQTPIQAAGIKTCRFCAATKAERFLLARTTNLCSGRFSLAKLREVSLFSKPFSEFECSVFKFLVLGSFYELVYAKVFVFQFANKDIAFLEFGN